MSLHAHGVVRIADEPRVTPLENGGAYFNCVAEGQNPKKKGGRFYYKLSIYVPSATINRAHEEIVKGCSIWVHGSIIDGVRTQKDVNVIFNQVQTAWWDIKFLNKVPSDELQ